MKQSSEKLYVYESPLAALQTMLELVEVALRTRQPNLDLVDLKLKLLAMDEERLLAMKYQLTRIIKANEPVKAEPVPVDPGSTYRTDRHEKDYDEDI
ncbi:MAG: hypothetical protein JSS76_08265 [Bacteroidetes bacterium]|nr:hypothetical protein [Bacteroidota bacterium]